MTNEHDTTTDAEAYALAVERLHASGCVVTRESDRYGRGARPVVDAPDGTRYRAADGADLLALAGADDLQAWQVPTTCAACARGLDTCERDSGATPAWPYCHACHYAGVAAEHVHADVVAACERRGLRVTIEQTGGGCMNLRAWRPHGSTQPWDVDASNLDDVIGEFYVPCVIACEAVQDDSGAWATAWAQVPDVVGGPWGAVVLAQPSDETGETWPDAEAVPLDAEALAAWADSSLPPARAHVLRVDGVDTRAVTAAEALDALQAFAGLYPDSAVTLAER